MRKNSETTLRSLRLTAIWFHALILGGCSGGPLRPVELVLNEEICSHCRMAISEQAYAAQVVSEDGSVAFYDDLGCLVQAKATVQDGLRFATFVTDYPTGEWVPAESAVFVHAPELPTPMRSGIVAFLSQQSAQTAAADLRGELMTWEQVLEWEP